MLECNRHDRSSWGDILIDMRSKGTRRRLRPGKISSSDRALLACASGAYREHYLGEIDSIYKCFTSHQALSEAEAYIEYALLKSSAEKVIKIISKRSFYPNPQIDLLELRSLFESAAEQGDALLEALYRQLCQLDQPHKFAAIN